MAKFPSGLPNPFLPRSYEPPVTAGTGGVSWEDIWDILQGGGGGGGGGYSYRPQTAEEAEALKASAALARVQAADIPLARELERRLGLAGIGVQQAERAANPRRIFEAIYAQARLKPTELAKSLQQRMNIPGFKHGGRVAKAAQGKVVEGPTLSRVGRHDDEYALLPPGSVIAPKPEGEQATVANALAAIIGQMRGGGVVSRAKAKKILKHGAVRGHELTDKQQGLFGLIAGGGRPTRLRKAQAGLSVWGPEFGLPQSVIDTLEKLRKQTTTAVLGAVGPATRGTSLFDPLGATRLEPEQAGLLRRLNLRGYGKLSGTQRGALASVISAAGTAPEDFEESLQRQFAGFNPVQAGTRARFAGILGRR